LTVYNRTRSRAEELAREGAKVAASPAEVAAVSEVVITIVTDSPDVEQVIAGPSGVMEGIQPGGIVIDMSTVSPELEQRLDRQLKVKGCCLLDAPVSGGDVGARNATLAIMAGGDRDAFDSTLDVLKVMGRTITYCGPVGTGQMTKLCNQILVSGNLLAVAEALLFARKLGLDPEVMINAVKDGAAGSWQLANLGPRILKGDYAPGFMVDLMQKDLRIAQEAADKARASLPAMALVQQLFRSLQAVGEGREGTQALAKVLERLSGA
jgi:3-hydroxyisobutyrate dehydrogenase-like beta-hydroxyacid dehydrogenase